MACGIRGNGRQLNQENAAKCRDSGAEEDPCKCVLCALQTAMPLEDDACSKNPKSEKEDDKTIPLGDDRAMVTAAVCSHATREYPDACE